MRKYYLALIAASITLLSACLKHDLTDDFSEADPLVKIDSVSYPGDGSAVVYGHIERTGGSDIEALGIYYGFASQHVTELTNQILVSPTNGSFEVWIDGLVPDSTYKIGCFVANALSSTKYETTTKVPFPDPVAAPCNYPLDFCSIEGFDAPTFSEYAAFYNGDYVIEFTTTYLGDIVEFDINFGKSKPVNGKYVVSSIGFNNGTKKKIQARALFGGNFRYFKDGDEVYVEQLSSGTNDYEITICQGRFTFMSSEVKCGARFRAIRP
jgi:hypothetical protein